MSNQTFLKPIRFRGYLADLSKRTNVEAVPNISFGDVKALNKHCYNKV